MHRLLPVTLAVVLSACGAPTPSPAPSPTATALAGDAAKVAALPDKLRAGVMLRAIRDAGQDCQEVVDQSRVKAPGNPATWIATCQDKRRWVVGIAPDGTATVVDANDVARRP